MLKQELKKMVNDLNKEITEGKLRYHINKSDQIIHIYWNPSEEFECVYSGNKTMFRWLKVRAYMDYCKTPRVVKDFYEKLFKENKW